MREEPRRSSGNYCHFHDGATCHGYPTLEECQRDAVANEWIGKILEREDRRYDGTLAKCYSMIVDNFDHFARRGTYVSEVKIVVVPLTVPGDKDKP